MVEDRPPSLIKALETQALNAGAIFHTLNARFCPLLGELQPLRCKLRRHKGAEVLQDGFGIERESWHQEIYTPECPKEKLGKCV